MKITQDALKQLIREELKNVVLNEEQVDAGHGVLIDPKRLPQAIAYLMKERGRHRERIEALELKVKQLIDQGGMQ